MAKKDIFGFRIHRYVMTVAFAALGFMNLPATEYFVSKDRPDDSGDGLTVETAKRTIQAAVELTKYGDIVTVLPGVYDEGDGESGGLTARVAITNDCIWLRSSGGKDKTFITGEHDDTENGIGDNALRCVLVTGIGCIVEGFTICNGATPSGERGGGVYFKQSLYYNYVCDSVLSNNVAHLGGAFAGGTLLRCKVTGNRASGNSAAIYDGRAYSSIFSDNSGASDMFRYCYHIVGCTIAGNVSSASYQARNILYSNCLVLDHSGAFGINGYSYATNSVFSCAETEFAAHGNCEFGVTGHHFVAAPFGDFRILSDSVAVGKGDAELTQKITIHNPIGEWKEYIAAKYHYRDFNGNPIPETGSIDCGALQGAVDPAGGCVIFYGDSGVSWMTDAGNVYLDNGRRAYAYAETYPTQWCARASFSSGLPLFKFELTPVNTLQLCHYPDFDGTFRFSPPAKGEVVTNHAYASHYVLHVDASSKAETPDGLTPETAFPTIQDAVDSASDTYTYRTYISVAPGVYDKGGAIRNGISNRVDVYKKTLRIVSTKGAEKTFIVGAPDPVTKGLGPNAVRCVSWYHSGRIGGLQGFTLTGGYTSVTPEGVNSFTDSAAVGGYSGSMEHVLDCIITNNHAHWAAATKSGYFFRCLIADNVSERQGTVWGSNLTACRVEGNTVQGIQNTDPSVLWSSVAARFCTIDGSVGGKSKLYASILLGKHAVANNCALEQCVVQEAGLVDDRATVENCFFGDPALAGLRDWRPLSCSPALTRARLSNLDEHLRYASGDCCSRPLRFGAEGSATAGAYQWPVQAVSVAVNRGGPDPITVTGGAYGTNALENASAITVTAQAKSASGRKFLGFTVDGVDYPADKLTYSVTQTGEPEGCISIVANYSRIPMTVILR